MNVSFATTNSLRYVDPDGRWRTSNERYAWAVTSEFAVREFFGTLAPVVSLAYCGVRQATGDITLGVGDWIWGVWDIVSLVVPVTKFVSDPVEKSILRGIDWSINGIGISESGLGVLNEVRQDRIIWKIAEKVDIVSADNTIDLDKHKAKFFEIDKFVKDVDKNLGKLPEKYQSDKKYKEWYEIYKKESM
ncbi:MAG: hypothetical protein ABIL66_04770 [candidate division WOR-3 bacterium]